MNEAHTIPDEPTDDELREAIAVFWRGGAVASTNHWGLALARVYHGLDPDEGSEGLVAAYKRVAALV